MSVNSTVSCCDVKHIHTFVNDIFWSGIKHLHKWPSDCEFYWTKRTKMNYRCTIKLLTKGTTNKNIFQQPFSISTCRDKWEIKIYMDYQGNKKTIIPHSLKTFSTTNWLISHWKSLLNTLKKILQFLCSAPHRVKRDRKTHNNGKHQYCHHHMLK